MAVPSRATGADLKPGLRTGILRPRFKERCQSLDALKNTAPLRRTPFFSARSAVTRACLCRRGAAAIGANERGWCLSRVSARAGVRPSMFYSCPHAGDGVERLRQRMASCWENFVGGLGLRLLGCVVWIAFQLAATCLVVQQLVRRDNASPSLDLAGACIACAG